MDIPKKPQKVKRFGMTEEYLRVALQEIKDDLLNWNNGNEFDEWSDIIQKISLLLKQLKNKS